MKKESKIFVAGHRGMVGSAIVKNLNEKGYFNIVTRTSKELDLRNQEDVRHFFESERPEYVFLAAAKVGGILANNIYRADFLVDNLAIQLNVIQQSYLNDVKKLLFLGSSCIYPKMAPQPLKEEYLLCNYLEETNEPYAIAKIAGLKMCENYKLQYGCNFISIMPANLYGPNDNYNLQNSHVLPALMRKFYEAKINNLPVVEVWGSGKPMREFLHVDDLAEACFFLMMNYNGHRFINAGSGIDITIRELAEMIRDITGYTGALVFDPEKPDGTPRKLLDSSRINELGWKPKISLKEGITATYRSYLKDPAIV
ncbi:MAG: GDP-L-fucose synthase [Bacteroidetes bacterium]|nr:GDP-L-fucose synthase [Bacteroidota bacterium]